MSTESNTAPTDAQRIAGIRAAIDAAGGVPDSLRDYLIVSGRPIAEATAIIGEFVERGRVAIAAAGLSWGDGKKGD